LHRRASDRNLRHDSPLRPGIVGLGIIGQRVAAALHAKGLNPAVWNRTPRPEDSRLDGLPRAEMRSPLISMRWKLPSAMALHRRLAYTPGEILLTIATIGGISAGGYAVKKNPGAGSTELKLE